MKIVVMGSLGNISKPLAVELVQKGHSVTVVSSNPERQGQIEALGAVAAIGSMEDVKFLAETFEGVDAVYLMEALGENSFFDQDLDMVAAITEIGENYKRAIEESGVKKIVHLSSVGAHTDVGNGNLVFHYNVEKILEELPEDVSITTIRPAGFYTNLLRFMHTVKTQSLIVSNYGGSVKEPWVSPSDIADVIVEELEKSFTGRRIRYVASDEVSPDEIAKILGEAINDPNLQWLVVSDEKLLSGMLSAGMNPQTAKGFVEMQAAQGSGTLYESYFRHKPTLGKVKLVDFAKEFALIYNQQSN